MVHVQTVTLGSLGGQLTFTHIFIYTAFLQNRNKKTDTFVILVDLQSQRNELKRLFVIVSYQLSGLVASVGAAIFGRHGSSGLSEQAQEKQEQSPEQGQREPGEGSDEGEQPVQ